MINPNQFTHSTNCFVKLVTRQTKPNTVVPESPTSSIYPQGLFCAGEGLVHFVLSVVAVCYVPPSLSVMSINTYTCTKRINRLFPLFQLHVRTTTCKPLFWVKHVDCKRFLEANYRLLKLIFVKVMSSKTAHRSGTAFFALAPSLFIQQVVTFDISQHAK